MNDVSMAFIKNFLFVETKITKIRAKNKGFTDLCCLISLLDIYKYLILLVGFFSSKLNLHLITISYHIIYIILKWAVH